MRRTSSLAWSWFNLRLCQGQHESFFCS